MRVRPDVAVGFMHSTYIPLGLALLRTGIPLVASDHIVAEHFKSRPFEALLLRLAPWLSRRMICVSDQARAVVPGLGRAQDDDDRQSFADPDRAGPTSAGAPVQGRSCCRSAGLIPRRTRRCSSKPSRRSRATARRGTCGSSARGSCARSWRGRRCRRTHWATASSFRAPPPTLRREYDAAQLFVLPSRYESFGLAVAEALSHGLPAVAFADCAGANMMIKPGLNGELADVTGDRAGALAAKFRPLMVDENFRLRLAEHADIGRRDHELPVVLDKWESLLNSAMSD